MGAALVVGLGDAGEHVGGGAALLDDLGGGALGLLLGLAAGGVGGLQDVGVELAADLLDAGLLHADLAAGGGDEGLDLGLLLGDEGAAARPGVGDAALVLLGRDLHLRLEGGELGVAGVVPAELGGLGLAAGLGDERVAADRGGALAAHGVEVADLVADVLDLQGVEDEAQLAEVVLGLGGEALGEGLLVGVDLLGGHGGEHAAEVALEGLAGGLHDLLAAAAEEALEGVVEQGLLAGDLDVGEALDVERDAALGVGVLDLDLDDHVGQVHAVDGLEQRDADRPAAADDAVAVDLAVLRLAPAAREDQDLVGLADVEDVLDDEDEGDEGDGADAEEREDDVGVHLEALPLADAPARMAGMSTPVVSRRALRTEATVWGKLAA